MESLLMIFSTHAPVVNLDLTAKALCCKHDSAIPYGQSRLIISR